jgi:Raf kinase inhibitor-like YbhB/YbcL family protein
MQRTSFRRFTGRSLAALFCLAAALVLNGTPALSAGTQGEPAMSFQVTSPAFKQGEYIPKKYTGEGADVSPPLQWVNPPAETQSFALLCDDPDAPMGDWVHWVIFNMPAETRGLPEAVSTDKELKDKSRQGTNDFKRIGYGGPMPPRGSDHRYFFKLYALDAPLTLNAGAKKADLLKAMEKHLLGQAELMGRYRR